MAAAASPAPLTHQRVTGGEKRVIAFLRELREEIQNLQEALDKLRQASTLTDPNARLVIVAAAIEAKEKFERNKPEITNRLQAIQSVFDSDENLHAQYGDSLIEISNRWDDIQAYWPRGDEETAKLIDRTRITTENMARIVFLCALLTIPERVNRHLADMRVGQALDFRSQFKEELPDNDQAQKVLEYLALHPKVVSGLVETESGIIFRSSAKPWRRGASAIGLILTALLPYAVIPIIPFFSRLQLNVGELFSTYAAIAAGSIVHIAIVMLKRERSGKMGAGALVADWLLWVHVKETSIFFGVLSLWVALAGLTAFGQATLPTAFFVGYSLDSFVDLFLSRFETGATAAVEAARAKLKPAS